MLHIARKPQSGFTLVEVLVVMTIIGIVATIAMPRIDYVKIRMDTGYRSVGMWLLAAQRVAVLRQFAVVVAFDTAAKVIRVHEDANNNGVIDAGERLTYNKLEDGMVFGRGTAPARPMGTAAVNLVKKQGTMPAVTFHRSGSAGEMGGFYLTSQRGAASVRYAEEARALEINRPTGRVSLYQYAGGQWRRRF